MERGWSQSKRSRVVKLPRVALLVRAARLRRSRSLRSAATSAAQTALGASPCFSASARSCSSVSRERRRPSVCRPSITSLGSSVVVIVVAAELVRDDIAVPHVGREFDLDRDRQGAGAPAQLAEVSERTDVVGAAGEQVLQRQGEDLGAVEVEELDGAGGHAADVSALLDPAGTEGIEAGRHRAQQIAAFALAGGFALGDERLTVGALLDPLALAPAAPVAGDLLGLVDEAELDVVGDEGEHLAGVLPGHRVVIAVEVDEAGLVDAHRKHQVRGGRRLWQGEEPLALLDEAVGDRASGEARVRARVGDGLDEVGQLAVALLDGGNGPASEEAIAQEADGALDLAFVLRPAHGAEPRLHVQARGELDQRRMKANGRAVPLQHHRLGIVEKPLPRAAAERLGGAHQRAAERLRGQVEDQLGPRRARPGEHQHECPERPLSALDLHSAHVCPVDLSLLADERLGAQERLARRLRAHSRHVLAQRALAARVTALAHHVEESRSAEPGITRERLSDELRIRRTQPRRQRRGLSKRREESHHPAHDVGVYPELLADRAHRPVLGEVQSPDLPLHLRWHGHRPRSTSRGLGQRSPAQEAAPHPATKTPAEPAAQDALRPLDHLIALAPAAGRLDRDLDRWLRGRRDRLRFVHFPATLIRHAQPAASAVAGLRVSVIEAALCARLVPRSGPTLARRPHLCSAELAAVTLPAIAAAADVEHTPATTAALLAKALLQRSTAPPPTRSRTGRRRLAVRLALCGVASTAALSQGLGLLPGPLLFPACALPLLHQPQALAHFWARTVRSKRISTATDMGVLDD